MKIIENLNIRKQVEEYLTVNKDKPIYKVYKELKEKKKKNKGEKLVYEYLKINKKKLGIK